MADPDIAHAGIAGWVLGALDPDESERFQAHLETCDECQRRLPESPGGAAASVWTQVTVLPVSFDRATRRTAVPGADERRSHQPPRVVPPCAGRSIAHT